ncbi:MAG: NmrA family transcriptional regulator [Chloroflexi bacterium]|nr:MAG: NmrA family transcriptional regulator [Chloroflexota bacterium]
MQQILVTGGTGTLGRLVVPRLQEAGGQVRILSRRIHESGDRIEFMRGDLTTGEGLESAVDGVETIMHLAGSAQGDEVKTRNLVRAALRAGARHPVYIAVVGADRIPVVSGIDRAMFGYFAAKRDAERVVAGSGLPWTTLRATQFHDLILTTAQQMARLPVIPIPARFRFQPVDAGEVAARLVELALGSPAGLAPDMAGPKVYSMGELLRGYLRASHRCRPMIPVWLPGKAAGAVRAGANLAPGQAVGRRTWEEFLADRVSSSSDSRSSLSYTDIPDQITKLKLPPG